VAERLGATAGRSVEWGRNLMPGIEDLYREIILDHYRSPRNRGELESPPALRVEGFNPLCGDEVVVTLEVNDGVVSDIKIAGTGCSISQSSASLMSAAVKGKPVPEVRELIRTFKGMMSIHESTLPAASSNGSEATTELEPPEPEAVDVDALGELAALQGVVKFPVRIKCATLSWNTLSQGLDETESSAGIDETESIS
jgi:nitrogen fixation protein NifU and related proteins